MARMYTKSNILILIFFVALYFSSLGCSGTASIESKGSANSPSTGAPSTSPNNPATPTEFEAKIDTSSLPSATVNITEGSAIVLGIVLNNSRSQSTVLNIAIKTNGIDSSRFQPLSSLTIPAGQTSAFATLQSIDDSIYQGPTAEALVFSISSNENAVKITQGSININLADNEVAPVLSLNQASQAISEATTSGNISLSINKASSLPITAQIQVNSVTATINSDFSVSTNTVVFSPGETNKSLPFSIIDDSALEGDESFSIEMTSADQGVQIDAQNTHVVTIIDDEIGLGDFSISGITSSNDNIVDANLSNALVPTLNWNSSSNATSYDVTIYENDGTTVKCATQNTVNTAYEPSACSLTAGSNYKAKVVAKAGVATKSASNSLFSFYVNQSPVVGAQGEGPWYVLVGGSTITVNASWAASPAVGIATDPEGDTLTITSVSSPTSGSIDYSAGNSLTFTPGTGNATGKQVVSYIISDSRGGKLAGNLTIHVVGPYTWTGLVSTAWSTSANWCGSIAANKKSCVGHTVVPSATSKIIFDDTCTSSRCTPTTTANLSVQGVYMAANGFNQGNAFTITVGSDGWTQSGGTFTGSNANITMNAAFTMSGGTFIQPNAITTFNNNFLLSNNPNYDTTNGTLKFFRSTSSVSQINTSNLSFKNVTFECSSTGIFNLQAGTLNVTELLTFNGISAAVKVDNGTIEARKNLTVSGYGNSGSALLKISGSSDQIIDGSATNASSNMPSAMIINTGGTVSWLGKIIFSGAYFIYSSGNMNWGTSTLEFYRTSSNTILITPGAITYGNVSFNTGTQGKYDLQTYSMKVAGNLSFNSTMAGQLNNGSLFASGNVSIAGDGFIGSGKVVLDGTNNQTIDASAATTGSLPSLEIALEPTKTLSWIGTVWVKGNSYNYISGIMNWGTSTLNFHSLSSNTKSISPGSIDYGNVTFIGASGASFDLLGNTLNISGLTTVNSTSSAGQISNGIINVKGNLLSTGYGQAGNASVIFSGNSTQIIQQESVNAKFPIGQVTVAKTSSSTVSSNSPIYFNGTNQNLVINSGGFNMNGFGLTVNKNITNNDTLQLGVSGACGALTYGGTYSGNAAVCP